MGSITASPNSDTDTEKTGFINRVFAMSKRKGDSSNSFKARFKSRHKKVYKGLKYLGIVVMIWLIFLAPWPIFR